jgi:hypothetical protein
MSWHLQEWGLVQDGSWQASERDKRTEILRVTACHSHILWSQSQDMARCQP